MGAGPAGLEAALALSDRGYDVILSEAKKHMGGRALSETTLKPLADWRRVADYRTYMLSQRANVQSYTESELSVNDILETGAAQVAIATGSKWRLDFSGLQHQQSLPVEDGANIVSVDDVLKGEYPKGRVLIYDDDHYYLASAIAEQLASKGCEVALVTPASEIASWTHHTLEYEHIQLRLRELGVEIICNKYIKCIKAQQVTLGCVYIDQRTEVYADAVIPLTSREPQDALYNELFERKVEWQDSGIKNITAIGDCYAPVTMAMAVYAGHEYARTLDQSPEVVGFFRRELGLGGE